MVRFDETSRPILWLILGAVLVGAIILMLPFMSALMWAGVLSVLLYPIYKRIANKTRPWFAATTVTILTMLVIIGPLVGFGTVAGIKIYNYFTEATAVNGEAHPTNISDLAVEADKRVKPILNDLGIKDFSVADWYTENRDQLQDQIQGPATMAARKLLETILTFVIALITMFFMLRDGHRLLDPVCDLVPLPREETIGILERMRRTIFSVFVGVVLVAFIQAGLATLSYSIAGVDGWAVWGLVTLVACLIPLLGPPVGYVPVTIILFLSGETWKAVGVFVFGLVIVSQVDFVLRPFVIGARTSLPTIAIFFALLGGVIAMGPIGLMTGPVLLTLLLGCVDVLRTRRRIYESELAAA